MANFEDEKQFKEWILATNPDTNPDTNCPVQRALQLFEGKWKTRILFELCKREKMRFGELKKAIPMITNTMLSNTLRDLEIAGVIQREQFNEIPPHVEYSLTECGKALQPCFVELVKWGNNNL